MNDANTSEEITFTPILEHRMFERFELKRRIYLKVKTKDGFKYVKFWTKNISSSGFAIEYTDYPFPKYTMFDMYIVFTLNDKVARIVPVDAHLKYVSKEHKQIGFSFSKKPIT